MKRLLVLATFMVSMNTHAIVDMKNANYADTWIDLIVPGGKFELRVERTYNSRSVFTGMFGFGWCSDFETVLEKTAEGHLRVTECGGGLAITYSPGPSGKDVEQSIDKILAYFKKNDSRANSKTMETLATQLKEDADLRLRWAKKANISVPATKKGIIYAANGRDVERIIWDEKQYTRTLADGTMQKFDSNGRLTHIYDKNSNYLKMNYSGDQLKEIIDNNGRKIALSYYANKKVKEILAPNGVRVSYKFNSEDLVEVTNGWLNTYRYEYDDTHNLTKITYPDKTFKALTYNSKKDWVTSFTDQDKCVESYNYELDAKEPRLHFWGTAVKKCGRETMNNARFEFWHKTRANGSIYLSRVTTTINGQESDIVYDSESGNPISVRKNDVTTTYGYYPNGLIKEKSTANAKMIYEYKNEFNKVSRVSTEFYDNKGKMTAKRETKFQYDSKGNLSFAANSDGQTVKLTYDTQGRIASIIDQAKKEVLIKYEDRFGNPAVITRPKVGSINVVYKPNGEIKKVESKDGPTVAVQVASTFNNLLDIIAPATSELNL